MQEQARIHENARRMLGSGMSYDGYRAGYLEGLKGGSRSIALQLLLRKRIPELEGTLFERIGFYGGQTDGALRNGGKGTLEYALRAYRYVGIFGTRHVQRKLRQYANRGPVYRTELLDTMKKLGIQIT